MVSTPKEANQGSIFGCTLMDVGLVYAYIVAIFYVVQGEGLNLYLVLISMCDMCIKRDSIMKLGLDNMFEVCKKDDVNMH